MAIMPGPTERLKFYFDVVHVMFSKIKSIFNSSAPTAPKAPNEKSRRNDMTWNVRYAYKTFEGVIVTKSKPVNENKESGRFEVWGPGGLEGRKEEGRYQNMFRRHPTRSLVRNMKSIEMTELKSLKSMKSLEKF